MTRAGRSRVTDLTFEEFIISTLYVHRPIKDMIEDIKLGNGLSFASGKLRELCKLLPEDVEVLMTHTHTHTENLLQMLKIFQLINMSFKSAFFPCHHFKDCIQSLIPGKPVNGAM